MHTAPVLLAAGPLTKLPGKLTTVENLRVGCMSQLGERGIAGAVESVGKVLAEMRAAA